MATGTILNTEFYHSGETVDVSGSYYAYVNQAREVVALIDLKKMVTSTNLTITHSLTKTFAVIGTSIVSSILSISSVGFVSSGQLVVRLASTSNLTPYTAGAVGLTGTVTFS